MSIPKEPIEKNSDIPFMQVQGSPLKETPVVTDMRELGATGLRRFSGFIFDEFLPELTGWRGQAVYKEMSKNDATCYAILFAIKFLCRRAKWFVEPGEDTAEGVESAQFFESCMNDMSMTWTDTINDILSMLENGYSPHEIVYKQRCGDVYNPSMRSEFNDGRIGWRSLPIRSPDTVYRWEFDEHGGIQGLWQQAPPHYKLTLIPIEKLLLFRTTVSKNNPEGESLLRGAYRSWWIKKNIENIESIGVERDLAGLPVAMVPSAILSQNASVEQKQIRSAIQEIVTNIRRNSQEGILFPSDTDPVSGKLLYELKLLSTGGSRQFDTCAIINRWDQRMAMTLLSDFILLGQDKVGSFALASSKTNLFTTAIVAFLDSIADIFNRYAVPRLFALNDFKIKKLPKLKHGDIGSIDLNELGTYIMNLSKAGMPLFPNPEIEKHLLDVAGIPTANIKDQQRNEVPMQQQDQSQKSTITIADGAPGEIADGVKDPLQEEAENNPMGLDAA